MKKKVLVNYFHVWSKAPNEIILISCVYVSYKVSLTLFLYAKELDSYPKKRF